MRTVSLLFCICLLTAGPCRADIGIMVHEPIGPLGFFTRAGHVSTYLSNVCPDGSPVRMRLCSAGEHGGVVSKYTPFSEHEDYDWAIVPFEEYLHGFGDDKLAPLIATQALEREIQEHQFGPLFSAAMKGDAEGVLPDGEWKSTVATRFERVIYILSVHTTAEDDAAIVAAFNSAANRSRFNFFYRNCSDQAKIILALGWPSIAPIGDRVDGLTMETPKGLAKALVDRALTHPDFNLTIQRYAQLPGTFPRSREVLFPLENLYKSRGYWPYWFFEGFREVAAGAMVYHEVLARFSLLDASRDFISPRASALTRAQNQLRNVQDVYRDAMARVSSDDASRVRAAALTAAAGEGLRAIRRAKAAETASIEGSDGQWRELDREFRAVRSTVPWSAFAARDIADGLTRNDSGSLADRLLAYFDSRGSVEIRPQRGAWMSLPLADGQTGRTGLSQSEILAGDPRVAALILAAVVDYNLHQRDGARDTWAHVSGAMRLLHQAAEAIESPRRPVISSRSTALGSPPSGIGRLAPGST
jgi:hypothetical protein